MRAAVSEGDRAARRVLANTIAKRGAPGSERRASLRAMQAAETGEADGVPAGHPMPPHLIAKVTRALEAPVEELVARNVITSGDVLARVLPQVTAGLLAANLDDPRLAALYAQTYAAFRRSLLLLNLEHQIRFEELPWIGILEPLWTTRIDNTMGYATGCVTSPRI